VKNIDNGLVEDKGDDQNIYNGKNSIKSSGPIYKKHESGIPGDFF
jgi:hypothetical protein